MKNLISVFVLILIVSCKNHLPQLVSDCINVKMEGFKDYACKKNASIDEYSLNGQVIYVLSPGDCGADMATEYYDAECNEKMSSGGIAGIICYDTLFCKAVKENQLVFRRNLWKN